MRAAEQGGRAGMSVSPCAPCSILLRMSGHPEPGNLLALTCTVAPPPRSANCRSRTAGCFALATQNADVRWSGAGSRAALEDELRQRAQRAPTLKEPRRFLSPYCHMSSHRYAATPCNRLSTKQVEYRGGRQQSSTTAVSMVVQVRCSLRIAPPITSGEPRG